MPKAWWKRGLLAAAALFAAIQLVPYGRAHSNPPVTSEPNWSEPQVRALAVRACFDCHSNETVWPWYSSVAPVSWLLQRDVDAGRGHLNFSEWDQGPREAKEAPNEVLDGEMPLLGYRALHRDSRLTANERHALVDGLRRTLGTGPVTQGQRNRSALERWLAEADAELRYGITRTAAVRW